MVAIEEFISPEEEPKAKKSKNLVTPIPLETELLENLPRQLQRLRQVPQGKYTQHDRRVALFAYAHAGDAEGVEQFGYAVDLPDLLRARAIVKRIIADEQDPTHSSQTRWATRTRIARIGEEGITASELRDTATTYAKAADAIEKERKQQGKKLKNRIMRRLGL